MRSLVVEIDTRPRVKGWEGGFSGDEDTFMTEHCNTYMDNFKVTRKLWEGAFLACTILYLAFAKESYQCRALHRDVRMQGELLLEARARMRLAEVY